MTDSAVEKLIQGYQNFRDDKFKTQRPLIEDLTKLNGWCIDIAKPELSAYDNSTYEFRKIG